MIDMWTEALLAYLHLACVLAWVVFLTSQAALLRPAWFNGAVVDRLIELDRFQWYCWWATLLSGLARITWGVKGAEWYWGQPLIHAKLALLLAFGLMAWFNSRRYRVWHSHWQQNWGLPGHLDLQQARRGVMWVAHLMLILPLLGVVLARGLWVP